MRAAACTCLVAVATLASVAARADADPLPARTLSRLLDAAGPRSGMIVADGTGRVLYARREGKRLTLASNTKLFVTGTALDAWGPLPIFARILRPSDNALAQALADRLGGGSPQRGLRRVMRFAAALGAWTSLADGSGLDPRDRSTPRGIVHFLLGMLDEPGFATWRAALPDVGHTGTMSDRMRGTAAAGRCHAKTGTLFHGAGGVSALSGYCYTAAGLRVFSILMNRVDPYGGQALQDRIVPLIARGLPAVPATRRHGRRPGA